MDKIFTKFKKRQDHQKAVEHHGDLAKVDKFGVPLDESGDPVPHTRRTFPGGRSEVQLRLWSEDEQT